mmetsp:Transcript_22755/g.48337  ORF Transcript_22755/g.48337 Transcript_22755/m.48337 type:complete len:468 (+) Transcript_22755:59-1462(+)
MASRILQPADKENVEPSSASQQADVSGTTTLFKGAPVLIRGLQGAPEYNGCKGVIRSGPAENGRYEVALESGDKVLSLKAANLNLDVDSLKEYVAKKREEKSKRTLPLTDLAIVWSKGRGLTAKALVEKCLQVPELDDHQVLLRVDKFAFSHMSLGYLVKGFTRTFSAYHNFYQFGEDGFYRSACWGYATVVESRHPKVAVGTRLYGLMPPSKYQVMPVGGTVPRGRNGEPPLVELTMTDVPFNLRRFQEMEVVETPTDETQIDGEAALLEDWRLVLKEIYTMAFYMDENLLVDTGMINSVIISCASAKTALALAYCLRMREMRYVVGLTSAEHLEFVKSTNLYHEVYTYDDVDALPNNRTVVYMDFKCEGDLRHRLTLRMGTNLMYNMVVGPAVFQKKVTDQIFEKRAREVLFDESSWRERRRMVAEVTKTGRNEMLRDSFPAFVSRMREHFQLRRVSGPEEFRKM